MTRTIDLVKVGWRSAPLIQSSEEFSTVDACLLETFEKGGRLLLMCAIDSVKIGWRSVAGPNYAYAHVHGKNGES